MGEIDEGGRIWTTVWPVEPGWYCFYGWEYGHVTDQLPGLHVVQVLVGAGSTARPIIRLIDGQFMYKKAEKHVGMFSRIAHPDMPSITALESELEIGRKK